MVEMWSGWLQNVLDLCMIHTYIHTHTLTKRTFVKCLHTYMHAYIHTTYTVYVHACFTYEQVARDIFYIHVVIKKAQAASIVLHVHLCVHYSSQDLSMYTLFMIYIYIYVHTIQELCMHAVFITRPMHVCTIDDLCIHYS